MGRVIPFVLPERDGYIRTSFAIVVSVAAAVLGWAVVIGALAGAWLAFDSLLSLFRG